LAPWEALEQARALPGLLVQQVLAQAQAQKERLLVWVRRRRVEAVMLQLA